MSEKTDYSEFKKSELENWIELSHAFLDNQGVPRKDGGTLSIYGRIERYSVIKSQELAALRSELDALKEAIKAARIQLQATQINWKEECLFKCNDILSAALTGK